MKPCPVCPWIQPGRPDITPDLEILARAGVWFCCHGRGGGTCIGAANVAKERKPDAPQNL